MANDQIPSVHWARLEKFRKKACISLKLQLWIFGCPRKAALEEVWASGLGGVSGGRCWVDLFDLEDVNMTLFLC